MVGFDPLELIWEASWLVQWVILLLVFFSVVSWAAIFSKFRELKAATRTSEDFMDSYRERSGQALEELAIGMKSSPLARLFLTAYRRRLEIGGSLPLDPEAKELLRSHITWSAQAELHRLEARLTFLATTASAPPFIGLFGTVVGIINAFGGIGVAGSASLAVVAPGIAEALIATALGLFAAIPATIFYNIFVGRLKVLQEAVDIFSIEVCEDLARAPMPPSYSEEA